MRITTKVMQNNSLSNINTNKKLQDKLNTQMATEKKINRPSDDPVVAIRALRLRTNVSQITQYYDKNSKDAESWLSVTEDALTTVSAVIEDLIEQATKGANENLTSADRNTILDALSNLRDEVYATGNADYAGRSIFTGYRTETTLKFTADTEKKYSITEQITNRDIDTITYVKKDNLNSINNANYNEAAYKDIIEQQITPNSIYRIRLAYGDVDGIDTGLTGEAGGAIPAIQYYDPTLNGNAGGYVPLSVTPTIASVNDTVNPYEQVTPDGMVLIQETGELLLGENIYKQLMAQEDNVNTVFDERSLLVTYEKSNWEKDDLKPEHYFKCADVTKAIESQEESDDAFVYDEATDTYKYTPAGGAETTLTDADIEALELYSAYGTVKLTADEIKQAIKDGDTLYTNAATADAVVYNAAYIVPGEEVEKQIIEYDVGMNQTIQVNTTADEVFTHAIGRDVDDLIAAMQEVVDMEETVARLESMAADAKYTEEDRKIIKNQLDAAQKALTLLDEKAQKLFEAGITKMQGHLDTANLATTNCGTRGMKLDLIQNRLMSQKTNFENLESENENVDVTEVAVKLTSAELTYEAALMATGKIMQTSLMNYI